MLFRHRVLFWEEMVILIFFVSDLLKFPDLTTTRKSYQKTNLQNVAVMRDFWLLLSELIHQLTLFRHRVLFWDDYDETGELSG